MDPDTEDAALAQQELEHEEQLSTENGEQS